jgi:hypothetical protein
MSPRVIHIPLSGGDRKHLQKELSRARSTHAALSQRAAEARALGQRMMKEAEDQLQHADRLKCEAWNAIMFCGGPAADSPTIGAAINAGLPLLRVRCNGCSAEREVDLRTVRRPRDSQVHLIEAALFCEACSGDRGRRQRAHIVRLDTDKAVAP